MSFGGVDEKKLGDAVISGAEEKLLPELDPILKHAVDGFLAGLRQVLDESEITITVKKKGSV